MLVNYLRIAFRNLWKNKTFSFINIIGLAVGMSITLLSLLYVLNELSFDQFHLKKDRVHRVLVRTESSVEGTETSSVMTAGVGLSLQQEVPEVESMLRISNPSNGFFTFLEENYVARPVLYADSSFFHIFTFPLIWGNQKTALEKPYSVVLTESFARKIFEDPEIAMGKVLRFNDKDNLIITGIVENPPSNSHLRFEAIVSFESLYQDQHLQLGWNGGWNYFTYILLKEDSDIDKVEQQFVSIAEKNINKQLSEIGVSWNYYLQELTDVHLNSHINWDINTQGSKTQILLFVIIAMVILIIACINFINLTTASSFSRMKEVGVRKVTGARRSQILVQFLIETLLISIIALIHAVIFIEIFSLWLTSATGDVIILEKFELYNNSFFQLAGAIIFLIISVGLIAGAYPALVMSRIKPAVAVKGRLIFKKGRLAIQNLLLVFQFTIAVILIISTLIIANQLEFLLARDKGFSAGNKIIVPLNSEISKNSTEALKQAFLSIPGIEKVGASSQIPGQSYTSNGYLPEGHTEPLMFHALDIDYNYFDAMGLEIVQGRNFSKAYGQDKEAYIINKALARELGWTNPLGKKISRNGDHTIIGVVEDYNFSPMHSEIKPLIITIKPWRGYDYLTIKTNDEDIDIKKEMEEKWKAIAPYESFSFFRLSSYISEAYDSVKAYMYMLLFCSFLAIFIASLGLFGLTVFITRKRYKEIAVRKVFGAGMNKIFILVSTGFLKWVLIANVIAWPIAYFIMDHYFLANYAYNTGIEWWVFFVAFIFSILISLFVILFQIIRLGRLNPVDYVQYE